VPQINKKKKEGKFALFKIEKIPILASNTQREFK
jgi:hypothetical protein